MKPVVRREFIEDKEKVERQDKTDIGGVSGDSEDSDQDEDQGEDDEDDNAEELSVSESDSDQSALPTSATIASSRNPDKFQVRLFLN